MLLTSNTECNIKLGCNKLHKYTCSIVTFTGEGGIRHNPDKTRYLKHHFPPHKVLEKHNKVGHL